MTAVALAMVTSFAFKATIATAILGVAIYPRLTRVWLWAGLAERGEL